MNTLRREKVAERVQSLVFKVWLVSCVCLFVLPLLFRWIDRLMPERDIIFAEDLEPIFWEKRSILWTYSQDITPINTQSHLIPKIIHQTGKDSDISPELFQYVESWKSKNPNWSYVYYNDESCAQFIKTEFPQYEEAYVALQKNVERADFFRYLVILRYGGVYADLDTECKIPMDEVIMPEDKFLVGWECDMPSKKAAVNRHFVRRRQVLQWVFAATPGHPILADIVEAVAKYALSSLAAKSGNFDTLERTGPGIWTDTILRHFYDGERVRILPQIFFGVHPSGTDNLDFESPRVVVRHHFLGTWKQARWFRKNPLKFFSSKWTASVVKPSVVDYFPVSVSFTPPFTLIVNACNDGELVGKSDVAHEITLRGGWKPGVNLMQNPRLEEVIAGVLRNLGENSFMLDVGAGLGFFSVAAASRQHGVVAFEPLEKNFIPLKASIAWNGYTDLVHLSTQPEQFEESLAGLCRADPISSIEDCSIEIGAIRIGASAWRYWDLLLIERHAEAFRPQIISVEIQITRSGIRGSNFVEKMLKLGYTEVYHSGTICDKRWQVLSKLRPDLSDVQQPVWCRLASHRLDVFQIFRDSGGDYIESILLVKSESIRYH